MTTIVKMPELWDYKSYGKAIITNWYVKEGEKVKKGDNLCQVMVSKITIEVPSPVTGVVKKILAPTDSEVAPGDPIVEIEE